MSTRSIAGAKSVWKSEVLGTPVSIGKGSTHTAYTDTSIVESFSKVTPFV